MEEQKMLDKLKRFLINMMCFLWITMACLIVTLGFVENEPDIIKCLLAILLWIVSLVILIKISPVVSVVLNTVAVIVIKVVIDGVDAEQYKTALESLAEPIGQILVMVFVVWGIFSLMHNREEESNKRETRKRDARERGEACCPRCGSTSIQYYPLGVPYESRYYDENGKERTRIGHYAEKYHCNKCDRMWR